MGDWEKSGGSQQHGGMVGVDFEPGGGLVGFLRPLAMWTAGHFGLWVAMVIMVLRLLCGVLSFGASVSQCGCGTWSPRRSTRVHGCGFLWSWIWCMALEWVCSGADLAGVLAYMDFPLLGSNWSTVSAGCLVGMFRCCPGGGQNLCGNLFWRATFVCKFWIFLLHFPRWKGRHQWTWWLDLDLCHQAEGWEISWWRSLSPRGFPMEVVVPSVGRTLSHRWSGTPGPKHKWCHMDFWYCKPFRSQL